MLRIFILISLIICGTFISCLYGIVHDQITYTISPEFYNLVRFPHHNISIEAARWGALQIAVINSWKIGFIISIIVSTAGLIHFNNRKIIRFTLESFLLVAITAAIVTSLGFIFGLFHHFDESKLAETVVQKSNFLLVQSIHNSTYIGGLIGMFVGIYWQFNRRKKQRNLTMK